MKKVITHELLSIQRRFFDVLDILLSSGEIKGGLKGFCELAGLNRVKYSHIRSSLDAPLEERPNGQSYRVIDIEALRSSAANTGYLPTGFFLGAVRCSFNPPPEEGRRSRKIEKRELTPSYAKFTRS